MGVARLARGVATFGCVVASCHSSGGWAQDGVTAAPEQEAGVADIVVTAQRRTESLQKVPIAVTALSSEELRSRGIASTNDIQAVAPGFVFTQNLNSVTPSVRGVGTNDSSAASEGAISLYVDGVYYSSMTALTMGLSDVERIEVLRGPQGTLFGRNSTGGAVQVVTRKPSYNFALDVSAGYGNYDTYRGDIFVSGGISSNLAASLSASIRNQEDGFGTNLVTGGETSIFRERAVRGKILFEPGADTTFTLSADYSRAIGDRDTSRQVAPRAAISTGVQPVGPDGRTVFTGSIYDTSTDERYFRFRPSFVEQRGIALRGEQGLRFADLISITSYRRTNGLVNIDQDTVSARIVGAYLDQFDKSFSQELQLISPAEGRNHWVVGGYYLDRRAGNDPFRLFSGDTVELDRITTQKTRSLAAYAQTTVGILDSLNLTLGGRYTSDRVTFSGQQVRNRPLPVTITTPLTSTSRKYDKFTWRAALDYKFNDAVLAYVSHNRGFKAGTFNSNNPIPTEAQPETLDALEAGIKADLLSRRLRINVSAYSYNYKDLQFQYVVSGIANTINAAKAKLQGFEIETTLVPTRGLTLTAGASIVAKAEYEDFRPSANSPGCPFNVLLPAGGATIVYGDCSGAKVARNPDFTINASAAYRVELGSAGSLDLGSNYYYNNGFNFDPGGLFIQRHYHLVNLNTTWNHAAGHLSATFWVKNLLHEEYFVNVGNSGLGAYESPAPPRTFGGSLRYRF